MVATKCSVHVLAGDETYLKENALRKICQSLRDELDSEPDYKVYRGKEISIRELFEEFSALTLFSPAKLIVIKEYERFLSDDRKALLEFIKKGIPKSTHLIIDTDDISYLREFSGLFNAVRIIKCEEFSDSHLVPWIEKYFSSRGKHIEKEAIEILKDSAGKKLMGLVSEAEKLITFVGKKDHITVQDAEVLAGKGLTKSVFDIAWLVGDKKVDSAIGITSDLIASGKRPSEILGSLSWHMNRVLRVKHLLSKGETPASISGIIKTGRHYCDQFVKQSKTFTWDDLKTKLEILLEADIEIKRTKFDPSIILELAIIRLCLG